MHFGAVPLMNGIVARHVATANRDSLRKGASMEQWRFPPAHRPRAVQSKDEPGCLLPQGLSQVRAGRARRAPAASPCAWLAGGRRILPQRDGSSAVEEAVVSRLH